MKTISSLLAYKSNLFTGYSDGDLEINPLSFSSNNSSRLSSLPKSFSNPNTLIVNMAGYKNTLFVLTTGHLYSIDPNSGSGFEEVRARHIEDCSQISIDAIHKILFLFSEKRGLVALDIENPSNPRYINSLMPDTLRKKGLFYISGMEILDKKIFLSVRNLGIFRIDYNRNQFDEIDMTGILKIALPEPQDVRFCSENNFLYILDYFEGLFVLDITNGKLVVSNRRLPNDDVPRSLILDGENAIIRGKKELYYFVLSEKTFHTILKFKVGCLTKYYNNIIFTRQNKINLLRFGNEKTIKTLKNHSFFNNIYYWDRIRQKEVFAEKYVRTWSYPIITEPAY